MLNKVKSAFGGKKIILGVSALAVAASTLILAKSVFAYRGDYTQKGPDCTPERHEAMEQAFEDNDYQAWEKLRNGRGRVSEIINEDNFARFTEAHRLAEEGNYEEVDKIRQELGLRTKKGDSAGTGYRRGDGQGNGLKNNQ